MDTRATRPILVSLPAVAAVTALLAGYLPPERLLGGAVLPSLRIPSLQAAPARNARLVPTEAVLPRLPQSPLSRRNVLAAVRRLDGVRIPPRGSVYLSQALGPWTGADYVFAPALGGDLYCARFGGGVELLTAAVKACARGAGLHVVSAHCGPAPSPAPVPWGLRIENPTRSGAVFRCGWRKGRPTVRILAVRGLRRSAPSAPPQLLTLAAVGDVLCTEPVLRAARAALPDPSLATVARILRAADVCVANLECPLTGRQVPTDLKPPMSLRSGTEFLFRGAPEPATALLGALGMDLMTVANNHILDYREGGIADTRAALADARLAAAGPTGVGAGAAGVTMAKAPVRISFSVYATSETLPQSAARKLPTSWVVDGSPTGMGTWRKQVAQWAAECGRTGALPVLSLHWGRERTAEPTDAQRAMAELARQAGARLVVGHHSHRLQPIDAVGGCVVAYSLGNFLFPPAREEQARSGILVCEVGPDGVFSAGLVPVHVSSAGVPRVITDRTSPAVGHILRDLGLAL